MAHKQIMSPEVAKPEQNVRGSEGALGDEHNKHLEYLLEPTLSDLNQITS